MTWYFLKMITVCQGAFAPHERGCKGSVLERVCTAPANRISLNESQSFMKEGTDLLVGLVAGLGNNFET